MSSNTAIQLAEVETNEGGFRHFFHGVSKAFISNKHFTADAAMAVADLDWNVSKTELGAYTPRDGSVSKFTKAAGLYVTSRDDTGEILGSVGRDFEVYQNREALNLASDIIDSGEANIKVMGSVKNGAKTFMVLELPSTGLKFAGMDEQIRTYLTIVNAHTGGQSLTGFIGAERTDCNNMLSYNLKNAQSSFRIRHLSNMRAKLNPMTGREMLGLVVEYMAEWETEMLRLLNDEYSDRRVENFLSRLFPHPESKTTKKKINGEWKEIAHRGVTTANQNREAVRELYYGEDNLANIRGTGFGLLNAVNEWVQHDTEGRVPTAREGSPELIRAENRFERILVPQGFDVKALDLLLAGAR